jgi:hypothetical protein
MKVKNRHSDFGKHKNSCHMLFLYKNYWKRCQRIYDITLSTESYCGSNSWVEAEVSSSGTVKENYDIGSLPTQDKNGYVKRTDYGSPCYT